MVSVDEDEEDDEDEGDASSEEEVEDVVGMLAETTLAQRHRDQSAKAVHKRASFSWGADGTAQRYKRTHL